MEQPRMSRARLFALIDAFERDMREVLDKYLLDHMDPRVALGDLYAEAAERRERDDATSESISNYLDLRPCYDLLNRHRGELPQDLAKQVRDNTREMDRLVPIRNRVMHGRPLRPDDPTVALSVLAAFDHRLWRDTQATILHLRGDVLWEPLVEPIPMPSERVLHNLPSADYDETGLVGREEDLAKLAALLKKRRDPVITITGEGGVGKTALALELAYTIVDDPDSPYDCVLWSSLKSEKLTAAGVQAISNAIDTVAGAAESIGRVLDSGFTGAVEGLAEALDGVEALIIVDNLESTTGDEVLRLYDAMPASVNFLFTSRIGIGEVERRYRLGPLSESAAALLLRKFARSREQDSLTALSPSSATEVVSRLRYSPLAIRWFVLAVEAGKHPLDTVRNQSELLEFCVANVYLGLSLPAKQLIGVIRTLDRAVQFDELALLTDMSVDTLRQCAQELGRGSLITYESDTRGGIASRIGPSLAVRAYLPRESLDAVLVAQLLEREQELRKGVERRREDESSRLLAPWTVHVRTEDDEPTAHLLRRALREGHRKSFDDASETIERARQLNPDYFEVDRVDAIVNSWAKQSVRAVELYRSALESCTDDRSRAIVSHFFAGHLAREMHDVPLAISYEREAHGHLQTSETAMALGNLLVWNREFVEGQEYLEAALDGASGTNRLIALTATVDSWRRWAEYLLGERKVSDGFEKARAGFFLGIRELDANVVDLKLGGSVVEALGVAAECFLTPGSQIPEGSNRIEEMVARVYPNRRLLESTRPWRRSVTRLGRIMRYDGSSPSLIASVRNLLRVEPAAQNSVEEDRHQWLVGEIVSYGGTYGFIRHPEYPDNLFFHRTGIEPESLSFFETAGRGEIVEFSVGRDGQGKLRATSVREFTTDESA